MLTSAGFTLQSSLDGPMAGPYVWRGSREAGAAALGGKHPGTPAVEQGCVLCMVNMESSGSDG
jgi:hypothetical protein